MDLLNNILSSTISSQTLENEEITEFDNPGTAMQFRTFMQADPEPDQDARSGNSFPAGGNFLPPEDDGAAPAQSRSVAVQPDAAAGNAQNQGEIRLPVLVDETRAAEISAASSVLELPEDTSPARPAAREADVTRATESEPQTANPINPGFRVSTDTLDPFARSADSSGQSVSTWSVRRPQESAPVSETRDPPVSRVAEPFEERDLAPRSRTRVLATSGTGSDQIRPDYSGSPDAVTARVSNQGTVGSDSVAVPIDRTSQSQAEIRSSASSATSPTAHSATIPGLAADVPIVSRVLTDVSPPKAGGDVPTAPRIRMTVPTVVLQTNAASTETALPNASTNLSEPHELARSLQVRTPVDYVVSHGLERQYVSRPDRSPDRLPALEPLDTRVSAEPNTTPASIRTNRAISATLYNIDGRTSTPAITSQAGSQITGTTEIPVAATSPDVEAPAKKDLPERPMIPLASFERWLGQSRPQVSTLPAIDLPVTPQAQQPGAGIVPVATAPGPQALGTHRTNLRDTAREPQAIQASTVVTTQEPKSVFSLNSGLSTLPGTGVAPGVPSAETINASGSSNSVTLTVSEQHTSGNQGREAVSVSAPALSTTSPAHAAPLVSAATSSPNLAQQVLSPGDPDFSLQFSEQTLMAAKAGLQKAQIRLNPASLGSIRVEIELTERSASVQFQVNNAAAKEAVELSLPKLREMFEASGLKLGDSQVGHHQERANNSQKGFHGGQFAEDEAGRETGDGEAIDPNEQRASQGHTRANNNQIDTFV